MAKAQAHPLDPCVHCGFCLPACPTYLVTGDEADSPRGRIVLMRALERGELKPDDAALTQHLDACLGCRGCEPVCPSGVAYGQGLEIARERIAKERGLPAMAKLILTVFKHTSLWRPIFRVAQKIRDAGLSSSRNPRSKTRLAFSLAMLDATRASGVTFPERTLGRGSPTARSHPSQRPRVRGGSVAPLARVAVFRGCVMDTLFTHVQEATKRTLEANGYGVITPENQVCCGALHDHAGDRATAQALAEKNIAAFATADADYIVVNSAGCGALLKDYGHLTGTETAQTMAAKVRDISELLAAAGPRQGAPLDLDVAYDAPCHLQHAQRVQAPVLAVLNAIPNLRLRLLPGSDRCCGSAGIYSILQPDMSHAVLETKIGTFAAADPRPDIVATGNPGCLMQIGAGLSVAGLPIRVAHPVEILDWSYRTAGYYDEAADT